ncbi:MAG: Calx-beta domain-containing protein [Acetivibrionales bacterium]
MVDYSTSDGSAIAGLDYSDSSGTLIFEDGVTSKTITIPINDDNILEGDESFTVTLSNASGGAKLGEQIQAVVNIIDDEQPPTIQFSKESYSVTEAIYGSTAAISVIFTGFPEPPPVYEAYELSYEWDDLQSVVSVTYSTYDGTAKAGDDYIATSGTLTFYPGEYEKSFNVQILDDLIYEGNETVRLVLSDPQEGVLLGELDEAVLTIIDNEKKSGSSGGGGGGSKKSVEKPPDGDIIDRMPGYIEIAAPVKIETGKDEIRLKYDFDELSDHPNHSPRAYYWNTDAKKWVALATYKIKDGEVKAVNDGNYKGWFTVFGVLQPEFTDIDGYWAEDIIDRMNGLGMVEGYYYTDDDSLRLMKPTQDITRMEFAALVYRLLNIDPDNPMFKNLSNSKVKDILSDKFDDSDEIGSWAREMIAALTKEGLITGNGGKFRPYDEITRIEAAAITSRALNTFSDFEPEDFEEFLDADDVPEWGKGAISEDILYGYSDGTLKPNANITRAEALTVLYRLLIKGMKW